jgi:hypothetical protein
MILKVPLYHFFDEYTGMKLSAIETSAKKFGNIQKLTPKTANIK